jgi:two-component sensor histidine kinase
LREVHHRIKNDMAMIQGLLTLQAEDAASGEAREALEEAQRRVAVMKNTYAQQYYGERVKAVELATLIDSLVTEISQSYGAYRQVTVSQDVASIAVPSRLAFPLGIIVNELLTNAYKYAFSDDREGHVVLRGRVESDQETLRLTVRDNGVGLSVDPLVSGNYASGLSLVDELAKQYEGNLAIKDHGGTVAQVTLRLPAAGRA